jgi:hypothetical protein
MKMVFLFMTAACLLQVAEGQSLDSLRASIEAPRRALAAQLIMSQELLDAQRPYDAALILSSVKLEHWSGTGVIEAVYLLRARALDAVGDTQAAFDSLLQLYATSASDRIGHCMMQYAAKLYKDSAWMAASIDLLRDLAVQVGPAEERTLELMIHSLLIKH